MRENSSKPGKNLKIENTMTGFWHDSVLCMYVLYMYCPCKLDI